MVCKGQAHRDKIKIIGHCSSSVQWNPKECLPGLVNFVTDVAYHFCLTLIAAFTQPGYHLLAKPCRGEGGEGGEGRERKGGQLMRRDRHCSAGDRLNVTVGSRCRCMRAHILHEEGRKKHRRQQRCSKFRPPTNNRGTLWMSNNIFEKNPKIAFRKENHSGEFNSPLLISKFN